jgi:HEAT repeat protein
VGLVRQAGDPEETVREWATAALEGMGAPAVEDQAALVAELASAQPDVAYWAATLLGRLGDEAAPSVDALAKATAEHPLPEVRQRAVWALGRIGPAAGNARPVLEQAAQSSEPRLARLAQRALTQIGATS